MKEKKIIHYVNFINEDKDVKGLSYSNKCFLAIEEQRCGIYGLTVTVKGKTETAFGKRQIKKLEKLLKRFDISNAVIMADNRMAKVFNISDVLFDARKYELIRNCSFILKAIIQRYDLMETAAVVIGSNKWKMKDLFSILSVVKNYFRKIDIVMKYQVSNITNLVETAYDEWGVVLHVYTVRNYHRDRVDFALLLEKKLKANHETEILYNAAYIVVEEDVTPSTDERNKKTVSDTFCGLVYKVCNETVCALGTQMAWQKPVLYEKFHVSVIDISKL